MQSLLCHGAPRRSHRLPPMLCFLNCLDHPRGHICCCRTTRNGMTYAVRHEPSRFPLLHLSVSAIAMPTSNSSEETSRWNCETERSNSSRTTEFGGDDLRNAMSDGDLLDCATPYSHYPFMSARGMEFVFEQSSNRLPSYSYSTQRHRRPSLAQISQVSVDSNFTARLDQPSLKVERIRLKSINCKLNAKLEVRRRAERRRFKESKSSDSSDLDSPLHRPKANSCSVRRSKRDSPETSEVRLTSSSSAAENGDEQDLSDDIHSSANNLSDDLRLFTMENIDAPTSAPTSPRVPYLQLATQNSDSSPRLSGSGKRDENFEKLSYEKEMREVLKGSEKVAFELSSPQQSSVRSTPPHVVFERDDNGDFRPAPSYFRIHRASLPAFSLKDPDFTCPPQVHTQRRSTIFEENNINLVTDAFSAPMMNGIDMKYEHTDDDDESHIENNRSEGSEIIVEVGQTPQMEEKESVKEFEKPAPSSAPRMEAQVQTDISTTLSFDALNMKAKSDMQGRMHSGWIYEMNMCKLLKLLFSEKERLESTIASVSKNTHLRFSSTRSQLAQERYRQHLRDSLRKVQAKIDTMLNQLAASKRKAVV
uniref:Protein kinase domain-containing protein n=1 Tax=Steinernema glaseri TaxID=37863 RepID=A0A1I8A8L3_9BILA